MSVITCWAINRLATHQPHRLRPMDAIAKSRRGGPCRNKPKTATALTDEQKAQFEKDRQFLELIEAGQMDDVRAMLDAGQAINVGKESGESTIPAIYGCCRRQSSDKEIIELLVNEAHLSMMLITPGSGRSTCCEMQEWGAVCQSAARAAGQGRQQGRRPLHPQLVHAEQSAPRLRVGGQHGVHGPPPEDKGLR